MPLSFLRPGAPGMQPVGDRRTAESAILLGVVNGLVSPPSLRHGCGRFDGAAAGQTCCQLASFVAALLGVALLVVDMALSPAGPSNAQRKWADRTGPPKV